MDCEIDIRFELGGASCGLFLDFGILNPSTDGLERRRRGLNEDGAGGGFGWKCSRTFSAGIFRLVFLFVSFSSPLSDFLLVLVIIGDSPSGMNSLIEEFLLLEPIFEPCFAIGILEARPLGLGKFSVINSFLLFSNNFDFFIFGSSIVSASLD